MTTPHRTLQMALDALIYHRDQTRPIERSDAASYGQPGSRPTHFSTTATKGQTMQTYIGTKMIRATAMTRLAYNNFRGWPLPANENGDDAGYLVENLDGGKPNTETHAGYVSSPSRRSKRVIAWRAPAGMGATCGSCWCPAPSWRISRKARPMPSRFRLTQAGL